MGKRLPKAPCPLCDLEVAYYPSTNNIVRHKDAGGEWCEVNTDNIHPVGTGGAFSPDENGVARSIQGELADWWRALAERDLRRVAPKAAEYSAYDMLLLGKATADLVGFEAHSADYSRYDYEPTPDPTYIEIGCWWYLMGKVARAIGAIKEGRLPSDDTVEDARIYPTMIARARDAGGWPGTSDD